MKFHTGITFPLFCHCPGNLNDIEYNWFLKELCHLLLLQYFIIHCESSKIYKLTTFLKYD